MPLSTRDISRRDDHGELCWDELAPEEREWAWEIMREKEEKRERRNHAIRVAVALSIAALIVVLFASSSLPAWGHDHAAWQDPLRDEWYRSLRVPEKAGRMSISCCDLRDVNALDPDKVLQDTFGQWWIDLGQGYVKVPPDRVVKSPTSIDGLPYVFLMFDLMPDNPGRIRCFVPPIPTY